VQSDAWLIIVIGASGVVAIVLVGLVIRSIRPVTPAVESGPSRLRSLGRRDPGPSSGQASGRTSGRAWSFRSFGPWHHQRSVEQNLHRAFARIDSVDPTATQRRIGSALAEIGLANEAQDDAPDAPDPERPRNTWPFGQSRTRQPDKDDE
jgi:hypothetical protein